MIGLQEISHCILCNISTVHEWYNNKWNTAVKTYIIDVFSARFGVKRNVYPKHGSMKESNITPL